MLQQHHARNDDSVRRPKTLTWMLGAAQIAPPTTASSLSSHFAEEMQLSAWFLALLAVFCGNVTAEPSLLTPAQQQYMDSVRVAAATASAKAETQLLTMFDMPTFRTGLFLNGAWKLAATPARELLSQLKVALDNVEYVTMFGVDPAWVKAHPSEPALDVETIQKFGHIPNMWELRARDSPLVNGTSMNQWAILDAAERGLYQMPLDGSLLPLGPNLTEAMERPMYIGGNLRRIDVGLARYGSCAAVLKSDVMRKRAALLPGDSGGWENACNSSVTPIQKWFPAVGRTLFNCNGEFAGGATRPVLGTADHQLHTILGHTGQFGKVGDDLSRLMYQLLTPGAKARPFETLLYSEAGVLGKIRPQDLKMIVASFPGIFGTSMALELQAFCALHKLPLVWALNGGETWSESTKVETNWLPFAPSTLPVGPDRLLDPTSLLTTNVTFHLPSWKSVWKAVSAEIASLRSKQNVAPSEFQNAWNRLALLGGAVQPLLKGECASVDECVGTYRTRQGRHECVCKRPSSKPHDDTEAVAPDESIARIQQVSETVVI
jgi:hypothetical protein